MRITRTAQYYIKLAKSHLSNPGDPRLASLAPGLYRKALALEPDNIDIYLKLARAHHRLGHQREATRCCENALSIAPDSLKALFYLSMLQIPIICAHADEVQESRRSYGRCLSRLLKALDSAGPKEIYEAAESIGKLQPFYLGYQAEDDLELQRMYGSFVCRVLSARYPQWTLSPHVDLPAGHEPVRVGIAADQFRRHSVWSVLIKGWVGRLNPSRFAVFGYALNPLQDAQTEYARTSCRKFTQGEFSFEDWCRVIRGDKLHVLIYPETGMARLSLKLAGLRLAPVQCASYGHSVTTGLPSIDYFISGELIEPEGADAHYSERLIRLPNMGSFFEPIDGPEFHLNRADFSLRSSAVVYLCSQSLFKYLPQYDFIYPYIARSVKDCQFAFFKYVTPELTMRHFERRLDQTFADFGLNKGEYVVMLPRLPQDQYLSFQSICDVMLDTIGWTGGMTTWLSLPAHLPIVTLPGAFMRCRLTTGILKKIGVTDTIARSVDDYLDIAVRLGKDKPWRNSVQEKMSENESKVYRDKESIAGLEAFLETAVRKP